MTTTKNYIDRRWTALILLCVAQLVVVLDASIVNVALPSIARGLHFSDRDLPWVVNAYIIAFGGFLLLGGRAADLLGRRRVFMAGLLAVAVASLAAGFAVTRGELIAARAAQGLGAAFISPSALSIVTTLFTDGAERNKALGVWGAVAGAAGAVGVLLGGVLTSGLSWKWVLWVNVPVTLIALALTPRLVPESRSEADGASFRRGGRGHDHGRSVGPRLRAPRRRHRRLGLDQDVGLLALAVALIAAFVVIELRSKAPLVPVPDLPAPDADRRQRGRPAARRLAVLDVLLHLAVHAAGAALQPDPRRAVVSAAGADDRRRGRPRRAARHSVRLQADPRGGHGVRRGGLLWFSQISADGSFLSDILGPSLLARSASDSVRHLHDRRRRGSRSRTSRGSPAA